MWEIITYGGGVYLVDLFNGVAALTGAGDFGAAIRVTLTACFGMILLQTAFGQKWSDNLRWFATVIVIYNGLLVPRVTVLITDRINPTLPGAAVANVPWGLGVLASVSSQVGDRLARNVEVAFSLPNDMRYTQNGFIFGSRLLQSSLNFEITNSEFAGNVREFMNQCVFYDLLLGHLSLEEMKQSRDLWTYLTVTNTPSQARSFEMRTAGTPSIVGCDIGGVALSNQWAGEVDRAATIFGVKLFPDRSAVQAKALLLSSLPVAHDFLVGASRSAADIMKQSMVLNAVHSALQSSTAATGNSAALDVYAQTRAERQTEMGYRAVGRQAEQWVPLLKIVLEALFYGVFPIVVLLFFIPKAGLGTLKNYFGVFVWLQSWPILYAILNRLMTGYAGLGVSAQAALPAGGSGISMVTAAGIDSVQGDVAVLAGYLSMSIPFLAFAIAKGATSVAGMATSMLAVPQGAAQQAAGEASTGNLSLGNTNVGNHAFNTMRANQVMSSAMYDQGATTYRTAEGSTYTVTSGGRTVLDTAAGESKLPVDINLTSGLERAYREQGSQAQTLGERENERAAFSRANTFGKVSELANLNSNGQAFDKNRSVHQSRGENEAFNRIRSSGEDFAKANGLSVEEATALLSAASSGIGFEAFGTKFGVSVQGSASNSTANKALWDKAKKYAEAKDLRTSFESATNYVKNSDERDYSQQGRELRESVRQGYEETLTFERSSESYFERARRFEVSAEEVERESGSINRSLQQPFFEWLQKQQRNGGVMGVNGARNLLESTHPMDRDEVQSYARRFLEMEVTPSLNRLSTARTMAGGAAEARGLTAGNAQSAPTVLGADRAPAGSPGTSERNSQYAAVPPLALPRQAGSTPDKMLPHDPSNALTLPQRAPERLERALPPEKPHRDGSHPEMSNFDQKFDRIGGEIRKGRQEINNDAVVKPDVEVQSDRRPTAEAANAAKETAGKVVGTPGSGAFLQVGNFTPGNVINTDPPPKPPRAGKAPSKVPQGGTAPKGAEGGGGDDQSAIEGGGGPDLPSISRGRHADALPSAGEPVGAAPAVVEGGGAADHPVTSRGRHADALPSAGEPVGTAPAVVEGGGAADHPVTSRGHHADALPSAGGPVGTAPAVVEGGGAADLLSISRGRHADALPSAGGPVGTAPAVVEGGGAADHPVTSRGHHADALPSAGGPVGTAPAVVEGGGAADLLSISRGRHADALPSAGGPVGTAPAVVEGGGAADHPTSPTPAEPMPSATSREPAAAKESPPATSAETQGTSEPDKLLADIVPDKPNAPPRLPELTIPLPRTGLPAGAQKKE